MYKTVIFDHFDTGAEFISLQEFIEAGVRLRCRNEGLDRDCEVGKLREYKNGGSVLHLAIMKRHHKFLPTLIKAGANPNMVDREALTPFKFAMNLEVKESIKYLLDCSEVEPWLNYTRFDSPLLQLIKR